MQLIHNDPDPRTPDQIIDGVITEVKGRELASENHRFVERDLRDAADQISKYGLGEGHVSIRVSAEAMTDFNISRAAGKVEATLGSDSLAFVNRVTIVDGDGTVLGEWVRDGGEWSGGPAG